MFIFEDVGFRQLEEDDIEFARQLRNDPDTWPYLTISTHFISKHQQQEWFEKHGDRYFLAFQDDYPVGIIRTDEVDIINRSIRIGLDIDPEYRKQGLGHKLYRALFEYYFKHVGMHKLWLCVLEDNERALSLYHKLGMLEDGRMRQHVWRDGRWKDYIIMSILDSEYLYLHQD